MYSVVNCHPLYFFFTCKSWEESKDGRKVIEWERERGRERGQGHTERLPTLSVVLKDTNIKKKLTIKMMRESFIERSCPIKCFQSRQLCWLLHNRDCPQSPSWLYCGLWPPLGLGRQREEITGLQPPLSPSVSLLNKVAPSLPSSWWLYGVVKQTRCLLRCPVNVLITKFSWLRLYIGRLLGPGNWMKSPECKIVFLLIWLYHCRHHLSWRIIGFK